MKKSEKKTEKKRKVNPISIILLIVLIILLIGVINPKLLFFLNENQQSAVQMFRDTYFTPYVPGMSGGFDFMKLLAIVLLIVGAWLLNKLIQFVLSKLDFKNKDARTIQAIISNVAKYAIVIFTIITGLAMLGVNMGAIIASLGILSLVIGFGAQSLIEDVITGIFILLEGQYHVGDIIAIDDFRGSVTNIGIRTTSITDIAGNTKIVNNSDIREMVNLSDVKSIIYLNLPVSFEQDLTKAEESMDKILDAILEKYPQYFNKKPKYEGVEEIATDAFYMMITAEVDEENIYDARRVLNRELKVGMDEYGIQHPTADTGSMDVRMID